MKFRLIVMTLMSFMSMSNEGFSQTVNPVENDSLLKMYLAKTEFSIDSSAQAVVLYEKGFTSLLHGAFLYQLERVVKVLGPEDINELSAVNIVKGYYSDVKKIKGITYNLENGQVVKQEIERSDVLKEKMNDNGLAVSKFNLPGVKKGSIIYYTYTIEKEGFGLGFVPDWNFQDKYPKLHSEYSMVIPSMIIYTPLERINVNMRKVENKNDLTNCEACTYYDLQSSWQSGQTWVRENIPAFTDEPYTSCSDNFKERISIHVSRISYDGNWRNIYKDWDEIIKKSMYDNEDLGGQLKSSNNFLAEKVKELTKDCKTDLGKAQTIFAYVRDSFTMKESLRGSRVSSDIKEVFLKKEGGATGLNLLLTAMLKKAGLKSDPLVLSTRNNERLNEAFPNPDEINYIVSKVNIDNKKYPLDASIKQLPFGTLMPECYNGYCRVVNEDCKEFLYLDPDSVNNKTTIVVSIAPDPKDSTKLLVKFDKQFGVLSGIHYRREWHTDTAEVRKMVMRSWTKEATNIELKGCSVQNLESPDKPLKISYEASLDLSNISVLYFDPYFDKFFDKNPFGPLKRKMGIEMDCLQDINYVFQLKLPQGYAVDDFPKSEITQYGAQAQIMFKNVINFVQQDNALLLSSRLTRKTSRFAAEDYESLRSFYENVMEEQGKKLILKKLN